MPPAPKAPKGLETRDARDASFLNRMSSSIMGTARFAAAMQRKVSHKTRIGVVLLGLVAAATLAAGLWIKDRQQNTVATLEAAMARNGPDGLAEVRALLENGLDPAQAMRAVSHLGQARDPDAVALLARTLKRDHQLGAEAARALARIGLPAAESAKAPLVEALTSAPSWKQAALLSALITLKDGSQKALMMELLADGTLQKESAFDQASLARLLGPEELVEALGHEKTAVKHFALHWLTLECPETETEPAALRALVVAEDAGLAVGAAGVLMQCFPDSAAEVLRAEVAKGTFTTRSLVALAKRRGADALVLAVDSSESPEAYAQVMREVAELGDPRSAGLIADRVTDTRLPETLRIRLVGALFALDDARSESISERLLKRARSQAFRVALLEEIADKASAARLDTLLPRWFEEMRSLRPDIGALFVARAQCGARAGRWTEVLQRDEATRPLALLVHARCHAKSAGRAVTQAARTLRKRLRAGASMSRQHFLAPMLAAALLGDVDTLTELLEAAESAAMPESLVAALSRNLRRVPLGTPVRRTLARRYLSANAERSELRLAALMSLVQGIPAEVAPQLLLRFQQSSDAQTRLQLAQLLAIGSQVTLTSDEAHTQPAIALTVGTLLRAEPAGLQPMLRQLRTEKSLENTTRETLLRSDSLRLLRDQGEATAKRLGVFVLALADAGYSGPWQAYLEGLSAKGEASLIRGPSTHARLSWARNWARSPAALERRLGVALLSRLGARGHVLAQAADPAHPAYAEAMSLLNQQLDAND